MSRSKHNMARMFSYSFKNIRRAPFQAAGSVLVLILTFTAAQAFVLVSLASSVLLHYFETRPQVTAFFTDDISEQQIFLVKEQMEAQPYVSGVTYISKAQALELYRQQNDNDPLLLEMVTADILPASLEVSARSAQNLQTISDYLTNVTGVEEVTYQKDVIEALQQWTNGLRIGGLILVGFLVGTSLLITTILISMKVAQKRQEIKTMRLLGASPWFVRGPFLLEGALYGLASAVIAWGVVYVGLLYATPTLVGFLGEIPLLPVPVTTMLWLLAGGAGAGVTMGVVSGSLSTSRY
jgi:cell division transport system permease protein